MTRVDFYVLDSSAQSERLAYVCRWVQRAWQAGQSVYIAVDNDKQAAFLDDLLWRFSPESFLPHARVDSDTDLTHTPIAIGYSDNCGHFHQCLVNLCSDIPEFFSRFERVAEVVCQEPRILEQTRQHYGFYKDRHHPINTHKISV